MFLYSDDPALSLTHSRIGIPKFSSFIARLAKLILACAYASSPYSGTYSQAAFTYPRAISVLIYASLAMAFRHTAPLPLWQKMGLFKAIFYSFLAVRRFGKALLAYALGWTVVGIAVPAIICALPGLILSKTIAAIMLFMPLSVIPTIVMY